MVKKKITKKKITKVEKVEKVIEKYNGVVILKKEDKTIHGQKWVELSLENGTTTLVK